jgi:AcrR family transcriptional regulator
MCGESIQRKPLSVNIHRTLMSNQIQQSTSRTYRKRRRAAAEERTRERIARAAADLHESRGPAKTTISAVADRAGVQRATVYRHFPDEKKLFGACTENWMGRHPLPDLGAWTAIDDPDRRLRIALDELYGWYGRGESLVANVFRDVTLVPAMGEQVEQFAGWFDAAAQTLAVGRRERGKRREMTRAAIGHAVSFATWRSLVREQGLSRTAAVELMSRLVAAASG